MLLFDFGERCRHGYPEVGAGGNKKKNVEYATNGGVLTDAKDRFHFACCMHSSVFEFVYGRFFNKVFDTNIAFLLVVFLKRETRNLQVVHC